MAVPLCKTCNIGNRAPRLRRAFFFCRPAIVPEYQNFGARSSQPAGALSYAPASTLLPIDHRRIPCRTDWPEPHDVETNS